ncbi:hypothetical protein [Imhoffiella purpurea]|nr:hypothetical protein [Imhoffiella purpurea]
MAIDRRMKKAVAWSMISPLERGELLQRIAMKTARMPYSVSIGLY